MTSNSSTTRPRSWLATGMKSLAMAAALGLGLLTAAPSFAETPVAAPVVEAAAAPAAAPTAAAPVAEAAAPVAEIVAVEVAVEKPTPPDLVVNQGDNAWMLISTALVMVMILPGLALFYGGLTRQKNMVSTLTQVTVVSAIGMVIYVLWGYSLAFTTGPDGLNGFVGGLSKAFLNGVSTASAPVATFSIGVGLPELTWVMFQLTFAAITAALVIGSVAERMKMIGVVLFAIIWPTLVYYPIAHMVWWWDGPNLVNVQDAETTLKNAGMIWGFGAIDFAGGTVVHINSGIAALMACLVMGKRVGYGKEAMPPHSLPMTLIGTGLLWFGWFGFNAGSNLESNAYAALAMLNTIVAPAAAGLSWVACEWIFKRKPSLLGALSGIVAGLVVVTPMAGFAGPVGAIISGLIVSPICLLFVSVVKNALKYDDSLDVFGIHCVGGIVGAILTGFVVNPAWGGAGVVDYTTCAPDAAGVWACGTLAYDMVAQVTAQLKAVGVTLVWSGGISLVLFFVLKMIGALRVSQDDEVEGLDISAHGERAYHN